MPPEDFVHRGIDKATSTHNSRQTRVVDRKEGVKEFIVADFAFFIDAQIPYGIRIVSVSALRSVLPLAFVPAL